MLERMRVEGIFLVSLGCANWPWGMGRTQAYRPGICKTLMSPLLLFQNFQRIKPIDIGREPSWKHAYISTLISLPENLEGFPALQYYS